MTPINGITTISSEMGMIGVGHFEQSCPLRLDDRFLQCRSLAFRHFTLRQFHCQTFANEAQFISSPCQFDICFVQITCPRVDLVRKMLASAPRLCLGPRCTSA
jgi:hypothetical protein